VIVLTRDVEVQGVPYAFGTRVDEILDQGTLESLLYSGWAEKKSEVVVDENQDADESEPVLPARLQAMKKKGK
jgi:hypothetical protein